MGHFTTPPADYFRQKNPVRQTVARMVRVAQEYGLPVKFLNEILASNYTFGTAWWFQRSHVKPRFNFIMFKQEVQDGLQYVRPGIDNFGKGGATAMNTVYHESTHAYLDLRAEARDTKVISIIAGAEEYYRGAPMRGDRTGNAAPRLTQEAAAEYVAHRVITWWNAMEAIEVYGQYAHRGDVDLGIVRANVQEIRPNYNKRIASHVHGYEPGSAHGVDHQVSTKKTIYPPLKDYCDKTILENKVPDNFSQDRRLREPLSQLIQDLSGFPASGH